MHWSRFAGLMPFLVFVGSTAFAAKPKPCVAVDAAAKMLKKNICISAHIYDVVKVPDGTVYLDVCPGTTPDDQCRFTIVSPVEDRKALGALTKYRGKDVRISGTVRRIGDRSGILLTNARQLSGDKSKFKPNPLLAHGFSADANRPPVNDPNLRRQGGRRAFMNSRKQEPIPAK